MWLKLFPDYHPPSADGYSSLGGILPTAFGGWKLFPSVYFLRNFSLMKYRLNGRIFTPVVDRLHVVFAGGLVLEHVVTHFAGLGLLFHVV